MLRAVSDHGPQFFGVGVVADFFYDCRHELLRIYFRGDL